MGSCDTELLSIQGLKPSEDNGNRKGHYEVFKNV